MNIIKSTNYKLIKDMWNSDPNLLQFFPKDLPTVEEFYSETLKEIQDNEQSLDFYEVFDNNKLIGFFGFNPKYKLLYTYFICVENRTPEIKHKFWNIIKKTIKTTFYAAGHDRNIRSTKFLKKMGGKELVHYTNTLDPYILFEFKEIN